MCRREGRPIPPQIKNAPRIVTGAEFYYEAFDDLLSEMPNNGFGLGRIPWSSIERWADQHGLGIGARRSLHFILRKLERVFIDHHEPKK